MKSLIEKIEKGMSHIAGGLSSITLFPNKDSYESENPYKLENNEYLKEINKKRAIKDDS